MADGPASKAQTAALSEKGVRAENGVGAAAARIAEALAKKNVLAIISSDYRAKDIHSALKGAAPKADAVFFQPSDALPGDTQPPTPANTGVRLAALRRVRELVKGKKS